MSDLRSLDWRQIIEKLSGLATSESGNSALRTLGPLENQKAAELSFRYIREARNVLNRGQRPFMESLDLFNTWYPRLEREATLTTRELRDIRHFCIEGLALKELLQNFEEGWPLSVQQRLMEAEEPLSAIDQIMTVDGDIRSDASETLFRLHKEKEDQAKSVQNTLDKLVKAHQMEPILQDRYVTNREGRWVLPIKSGMQHQFSGIIHASSQSKQTVFMEPQEIVPINNRLRQIATEIEEEITKLLNQLSQYLKGLTEDFGSTQKALLEADICFAKAQLSSQLQANSCEFSTKKIHLKAVRHPLLILNSENVIPNDVELTDERRVLILSGPNAGGKTVLLKSIGLAVQMARCGLPVCADEDSKVPFIKNYHVAVGDSQSVDAHLSTFAAHLKVLNEATKATGKDSLILIDEICGSTDPEEGAALARSFIHEYAKNGCYAVITSHLGALKADWEKESCVINGSLEFDDASGPTYQFFMGIPGSSLAVQTAQRVGVDKKIIDQALSFLSPESKNYHSRVQEVEIVKQEMDEIKKELLAERHKAQVAKQKYQKLFEKFEKEKSSMLDQSLKRAERKVETLIRHAKVDDAFKKHEELQKIKTELPEIIKKPKGGGEKSIQSPEEFTKAYPPGAKIFVPSIGRDGIVQGRPNSKGEVPILSNSMRLTVSWESLRPAHEAANPTQEILRRSQHYGVSAIEGDRIVDVRGLTLDEATEQLELQLDTAALNQEDRVKLIHGHGTDALKRGLRSYLSRSVYVKKWQAGTKSSGGDGITWIEIKD